MPPKKRNLTEIEPSKSGSRRRSTRLSSTGKRKSLYFEDEDDVDDSEQDGPPPRKTTKTVANASRAGPRSQKNISDDEDRYEDEDISEDENGASDDFDEDDDSATATPPPKPGAAMRGRGRPAKNPRARADSGKTQARTPKGAVKKVGRPTKTTQSSPGAKRGGGHEDKNEMGNNESDDSDDDDEEPRVTFIPLPKLRDTNGVDYEETKVHLNTLLFLGDLKANNKRSWLKSKFNLVYLSSISSSHQVPCSRLRNFSFL